MAVLYLAVEDDFVAVLAEVVLGVVDGLEEAVLDQDLGLEIVCKVTKLKDGIENHCLDADLISNVLFVWRKFSLSVLLPGRKSGCGISSKVGFTILYLYYPLLINPVPSKRRI